MLLGFYCIILAPPPRASTSNTLPQIVSLYYLCLYEYRRVKLLFSASRYKNFVISCGTLQVRIQDTPTLLLSELGYFDKGQWKLYYFSRFVLFAWRPSWNQDLLEHQDHQCTASSLLTPDTSAKYKIHGKEHAPRRNLFAVSMLFFATLQMMGTDNNLLTFIMNVVMTQVQPVQPDALFSHAAETRMGGSVMKWGKMFPTIQIQWQ